MNVLVSPSEPSWELCGSVPTSRASTVCFPVSAR